MAAVDVAAAIRERLDWRLAERNDQFVGKVVGEGEEVDAIFGLEEAGLLDGFLHFLEATGVLALVRSLTVQACRRLMVPVVLLVLTYFMKVLMGIPSVNALPALLFSNQGAMLLLGFDGYVMENGLSRRSHEKRGEGKAPPTPFSERVMSSFPGKMLVEEVEGFFNGAIRCLAVFGVFAAEVTGVIDGTDIETAAKYQGAGKVIRKRNGVDKRGQRKEIEVVVFGVKAIVLYELRTRIPLAVQVVTIEKHESQYTLELVRQGQENLSGRSRIVKVIVDRGFLDGETLWQLDEDGILYVVCAKSGMHVKEDARALAAAGEGHRAKRKRKVVHGRGKTERVERLETERVGIEGLLTFDAYNSAEGYKHHNRKDYEPKPIDAVVVLKWDNKDYGQEGRTVYLTNESVVDPFLPFDDYDGRSLIENTLFREGKQAWHLKKAPKKTAAAVTSHVFMTFAVLALTAAYRLHEQAETLQDEMESQAAFEEGVRQWRRRMKQENQDKVIIFVGDKYGILHVAELAVLTGVRLKKIPPELGTRDDILRRYGVERG